MEWLALGVAGGAVLLFLIPQLVKEINRPRRKRRKATSPPTGTTPAPASAQIDQPHTPGRVLFLVEIDGYWHIVTPAGVDGKRKSVKLCPKLNPIQTFNQANQPAPQPEDATYHLWQEGQRLANKKRTMELCLTIDGAREVERLEGQGFTVKLPE